MQPWERNCQARGAVPERRAHPQEKEGRRQGTYRGLLRTGLVSVHRAGEVSPSAPPEGKATRVLFVRCARTAIRERERRENTRRTRGCQTGKVSASHAKRRRWHPPRTVIHPPQRRHWGRWKRAQPAPVVQVWRLATADRARGEGRWFPLTQVATCVFSSSPRGNSQRDWTDVRVCPGEAGWVLLTRERRPGISVVEERERATSISSH